ncbi:hypothetical protein AMAG_01241 [Allomyces macrogynus ATCC 38327]|uniref:Ribosomal protein L10 n=1 Tax=Allomyces macrogynus (strain ATCC 38327) TaxID=578462 RepID=A0A0L0RZ34_ALLM3|nr:hypothetical protein AMAG_01241 [Allomyces macrogynus ATCC 38327]|eukprot:KNE55339.1 hypothetical protein AMAG_01241 [Allomyces macrogynus ATCC 38327]
MFATARRSCSMSTASLAKVAAAARAAPKAAAAAPKAAKAVAAEAAKPKRPARRFPLKKALLQEQYTSTILKAPAVLLVRAAGPLAENEWQTLRDDLRPHGLAVTSVSTGVFSVAAKQYSPAARQFARNLDGQNLVIYRSNKLVKENRKKAALTMTPEELEAVKPRKGSKRLPQFVEPALVQSLLDRLARAKKLQITGAVLDGNFYQLDGLQNYATLPTMDQLRGQLVGLLSAPASRLTGLLSQSQQSLVMLLGQRVKDMEAAARGDAPSA